MSLILDHINYCYSADSAYKVQALKDVSLEINDGEFIGIIGHTGSGKSTLIQHMNGLLKATSGHIYYNGQDIYDNDYDLSKLRHKVGMVFQYPEHQLFETTNFEDVCFGPKNQGLDRKTVELRAYEALQNVHFPEDLYYQPPFDLSGGQKRRVAIAGVLAMHPDVLILDEPTAGLDPAGRDEILGLLLQMKKDLGITIILVSHSMEDVAEYVDRIIVMNSGDQSGSVSESGVQPISVSRTVVKPHNRQTALNQAVYCHNDQLLHLKIRTEECNRRIGIRHQKQIDECHHKRTEGIHNERW